MKYEMIFGDEKLFDGAGEFTGIDIVTRNVDDGLYRTSRLSDCTPSTIRKNPIVAMRRIIKDPETWTWEDKKAGRLPEVGCRVDFCHKLNTNWRTGEIKYIDNQVAVIKADDIDRPFVYEFDLVEFNPIETPEEKAQRLRSEWISKAYVDFHRLGCELEVLQKEQIKQIYDALLSGELTMPNKDGE